MRAEDLVRTMDSFVGTYEDPWGSNRTWIGREYGWNGVPWCAITVSVACNRNGFPLHTAAVIEIETLARQGWNGMRWTRTPTYGSAVCFDWNGYGNPANMHTGVVYEVLGGGSFRTIEGNYQNKVGRWLRDMRYVRGFATFPSTVGSTPPPPVTPPPPPKEETDNMIRFMKSDSNLAVYIVDADFQSKVGAPDEAWLKDAAFRLGGRIMLPPTGTKTVAVNGVTVEIVTENFLKVIPTVKAV